MDLANLSARTLTALMRDGTFCAVDVMNATYDRIEAWNSHVNAIVSLTTRVNALEHARAADSASNRGPLHGLPIAIKDLANAAQFVTSMGSSIFADGKPAQKDDLIVERMRKAGAIVIGKTNTPEFGLGSHTVNPVYGPTLNPWDLARSAGGSSGGASVALATAMLSIADGSDMMGSLRNPAGWNNVYGLRPTWGAVPSEPSGDTFLGQLATPGPMARNPEDLELLLSVIAGRDPRQPHHIDLPREYQSRSLRIAWLGDWGGSYAMEPGILECCENALSLLSDLGHFIEPLKPEVSTESLWTSWTTLRSWQVATQLIQIERTGHDMEEFGPPARWELERGRALSAIEVHDASILRAQWYAQTARLFEKTDILALPTAQCWPFDARIDWPHEIAGQKMDTYHRWMEVVVPASLAGLPTLAVPAGFGAAGLPMGLQLIGSPKSDYQLIELGKSYHARAHWTGRAPTLKAL